MYLECSQACRTSGSREPQSARSCALDIHPRMSLPCLVCSPHGAGEGRRRAGRRDMKRCTHCAIQSEEHNQGRRSPMFGQQSQIPHGPRLATGVFSQEQKICPLFSLEKANGIFKIGVVYLRSGSPGARVNAGRKSGHTLKSIEAESFSTYPHTGNLTVSCRALSGFADSEVEEGQ